MTRTQRSVIELVRALWVLAWLAAVGTPDAVEHAEEVDGDDVFARLRESSGGAS